MTETTLTHRWCGLLRYRQCLVPTTRGWVLLLVVASALAAWLVGNTHAFLAISDPRPAGALVVEGWVSDDVFAEAVAEYRRGSYQAVFVTGGPLDRGTPLSKYGTYAESGAAILIAMGLSPSVVHPVPARRTQQDRTFASAVALRKWWQEQGRPPAPINLVSLGPHARRSRLLFAKALGPGYDVGVLSIPDQRYDAAAWWTSSAGFRLVTGELIAYLYSKLWFRPRDLIDSTANAFGEASKNTGPDGSSGGSTGVTPRGSEAQPR